MSNNDYVKPPKKSVVKNAAGAMKGAYAYLHPGYCGRTSAHLIIVVPVVFIIYTIIYGILLVKLSGMNNNTMPWTLKALDLILISITTIICAYFYPFSYGWYKQSFTGSTLDDRVYIGTSSEVVSDKMKDLLFGIIISGVLAPITGPLALRKCIKKKMVIGEEGDFKYK